MTATLVDQFLRLGSRLVLWPVEQAGGPIAAVQEGDRITIDLDAKTIDVDLPPEEIEARLRAAQSVGRPIAYRRGVLAKYARLVSSASLGAITH